MRLLMSVRSLGISSREDVQQRPQCMSKSLGGVFSDLVSEKDPHSISMLRSRLMLDSLYLGQHLFFTEKSNFKSFDIRFDSKVVQERLVVHPIYSTVGGCDMLNRGLASRHYEQVSFAPFNFAVLRGRFSWTSDDIESLRSRRRVAINSFIRAYTNKWG